MVVFSGSYRYWLCYLLATNYTHILIIDGRQYGMVIIHVMMIRNIYISRECIQEFIIPATSQGVSQPK